MLLQVSILLLISFETSFGYTLKTSSDRISKKLPVNNIDEQNNSLQNQQHTHDVVNNSHDSGHRFDEEILLNIPFFPENGRNLKRATDKPSENVGDLNGKVERSIKEKHLLNTKNIKHFKRSNMYSESTHPKTYGMILKGEEGYIWNTLINPPTQYAIGDTQESIEDEVYEESANCNYYIADENNDDYENALEEINNNYVKPDFQNDAAQNIIVNDAENPLDNEGIEDKTELAENFDLKKISKNKHNTQVNNKNGSDKFNFESKKFGSKEFWTWAAQWAEEYTKLWEEHIKDLIKQEFKEKLKEAPSDIINEENIIDENESNKNISDYEKIKDLIDILEKISTFIKDIDEKMLDKRPRNHLEYSKKQNSEKDNHTPYIYINAANANYSEIGNEHTTNVFIINEKKSESDLQEDIPIYKRYNTYNLNNNSELLANNDFNIITNILNYIDSINKSYIEINTKGQGDQNNEQTTQMSLILEETSNHDFDNEDHIIDEAHLTEDINNANSEENQSSSSTIETVEKQKETTVPETIDSD